tara:strand:- start:265 stop:573 length:309 start_codon:yes stop_codon:yes gene_type:complete
MNIPQYKFLKDQLESEIGQKKIEKVKMMSSIAKNIGISMAQMSIAWCLKNQNVSTVILGATNTKQLDENLSSIGYKELLDDEIMKKIDEILDNKPIPEQDLL